jgi:hypothetical protein
MIVQIKDESPSGKILNHFNIELENPTISLREIIFHRVASEVEKYNSGLEDGNLHLVTKEQKPQGVKGKYVDIEMQQYLALTAFQQNGFFVLIDDLQCESLDQVFQIKPNSTISFVKLVPLIGG